jgi:hypothetical protein
MDAVSKSPDPADLLEASIHALEISEHPDQVRWRHAANARHDVPGQFIRLGD